MSNYKLRLVEDKLVAGGEIALPALTGHRVVYVAGGSVDLEGAEGSQSLAENSGRFGSAACSARSGGEGATLWRWELVDRSDEDWPSDAQSSLKASHELELDPPQGEYMMRCDRVDFPLGGIAYTHIHSGPGLRCLLRGELSVIFNEGEEEAMVAPGGTWFERGPDPIYAQASDTELTSFVRSMVLPREYKGRTSITYVKPEDADKPKPQEYTRFVDEFVDL